MAAIEVDHLGLANQFHTVRRRNLGLAQNNVHQAVSETSPSKLWGHDDIEYDSNRTAIRQHPRKGNES